MTEEPYSLLFLSCDLVGSTQYKQQNEDWQQVFLSFYRQFPQQLVEVTADQDVPAFTLWKPVGDELIYRVVVQHERDIWAAVFAWLKAMDGYERGTLLKRGLGLKGGAFVATFPGPDSEATVPRSPDVEVSDADVVTLNRDALAGTRDHDKYLFDYFGPSIDTGFRIFNSCSRRMFTLSIEVTWALQRCAQDIPRTLPALVWVEAKALKGVWGDREYPVFALDREHQDPVNGALKQLHGQELGLTKVAEVCRACMDSDRWPSSLYLPGSGFDRFTRVPRQSLAGSPDETGALDMAGAEELVPDQGAGSPLPDDPPMAPRGSASPN